LRGEINMSKKTNLQDQILDKLREERVAVTVFTLNGFQMKGRITAFDQYMIVLEIRNVQQFVYKHAISTIQPNQPIGLDGLGKED